jgi:hypothetical protein
MGSTRYLTLLDVIQAVGEVAASDQETLATVADLINRGQVRLCGDAAGATIDLSATEDTAGLRPEIDARCMAGEAWTEHGPAIKGPATPMSGALRPGRGERHAA